MTRNNNNPEDEVQGPLIGPLNAMDISNEETSGGAASSSESPETPEPWVNPMEDGGVGVYMHKKVDEGCERWRWKIENWSQLESKVYSPQFTACGYPWRFLVFPRGNRNKAQLAVYIDVPDFASQPAGWSRHCAFLVSVLNQKLPNKDIDKDTEKKFIGKENDWGFQDFCNLTTLEKEDAGFIVNDTVVLEVAIKVLKDTVYQPWAVSYNPRKDTGFVGLKNQGATCYMNSLLQTLFFISDFRRAVYRMPTEDEDPDANMPSSEKRSIPLALQKTFYRLQTDAGAVDTKELTRSFGWDNLDSFQQHDVQELARVLCDKLDEKMKKFPEVAGTIPRLFEGKTKSFIKCINVDYESSRLETFQDISLDIKGCANIYDSFAKYVEVETLEGDNKYQAEGHGLQDAKKGVVFNALPPVLMLQLKRFEYDFMRDVMCKINDRFEFYPEINLDRFMAPDAASPTGNEYVLLSVLIHSGDVHGGHYYSFLQHKNQWIKFDDDRVTICSSEKDAIDDSFGGEALLNTGNHFPWARKKFVPSFKKYANAYMLVYVRKRELEEVLCPIEVDDVPKHVIERFERDRAEKERKEKEKQEAYKYANVKFVTDADLKKHSGFDLIEKKDDIKTVKVLKTATMGEVKKQLEEEFKIPADRQRLWSWIGRQNKTYRPSEATLVADDTPFEKAVKLSYTTSNYYSVKSSDSDEATLLLEHTADEKPLEKTDMILFVKYYDPITKQLQYVGNFIAQANQTKQDIQGSLNRMMNFPEDQDMILFEEVRVGMINDVPSDRTLSQCELQNGDILVFQRVLSSEEAELHQVVFKTAKDYFEFLQNRVEVKIYDLAKPADVAFSLELSYLMSYSAVCDALAMKLSTLEQFKDVPVASENIRLTGQYASYNPGPKSLPFKTSEVKTLRDMLIPYQYSAPTDSIYYEVLDVPVAEVEGKKAVTVAFFNNKVEEVLKQKILVPKEGSTVADVLARLSEVLAEQGFLSKDGSGTGKLRIFEVWSNKIFKEYNPSDKVDVFSDYSSNTSYRVEEVSSEEAAMEEGDRLIQVLHVAPKGSAQWTRSVFGQPFIFVIKKDDKLADVRARIQKKLDINDEEMSKVRLCRYTYNKCDYIPEAVEGSEEAEVNVVSFIAQADAIRANDVSLAMEHKDNAVEKKSATGNGWSSAWRDKPIVIRGD